VAGRLREQGLTVQTRIVVARHAAEAILAEAEAQASNLIAPATHGRGGFKRLMLGSVADKLIRGAASPILVYRPTGKGLT
jgi:nucleotide-binding universal stress UspA family protein